MDRQQSSLTPPVRVALIGCGQIGRLHAQRLARDPRVELAAFCDPLRDNAVQLAAEYADKGEVFDDFTALLESPIALDAAVICTPTQLHFEQTTACRARGWHVLCEKPLAESRERIVKMIDAAGAGGPLLSVAYQRRHWAIYQMLRRELQSGRWGPIQTVTFDLAERWQQTIGGTWRDSHEHNPGGFLGDAGSHKVDLLFFLTGLQPEEVYAVSHRHGSQVEIVTAIAGKLTGDVTLSMTLTGNAEHYHEDIVIYCQDADFIVKQDRLWRAENNDLEEIPIDETCSDPDRGFVDCLVAGATNPAAADCALPVFDFTAAVLRSAETGRMVRCE
ncbi:Gfo/Idh/MocA family oxidoreductase [Symmachiella dynata]|uniref:Gfo/Idh/MocA family protein n=1 Tax=Symmachiella dynata TaxID=2527995 RepID=UPI0030EE6299